MNGFGGHRIEGIGDKHVPWIHNIRNTDIIIAADDQDCMNQIRLFNEPAGQKYLAKKGVSKKMLKQLQLLGISSVGNVISAIKFAKYYELTSKDIVLTVWTDSMEMYESRMKEMRKEYGTYKEVDAAAHYEGSVLGIRTDHMLDLRYKDAKRVHNLKYYTWIEQQARELDELNDQWYRYPDYWTEHRAQIKKIDNLINKFNDMVGIL